MSSSTNREGVPKQPFNIRPIQLERKLPFLRRNARVVTQHFKKMGSTLSTMMAPNSARPVDEPELSDDPPDEEDDEDARPAKRRKTGIYSNDGRKENSKDSRRPFSHVMNESTGSRRLDKQIPPESFYSRGKARPVTPSSPGPRPPDKNFNDWALQLSGQSITKILPPEPFTDFRPALRVEVKSIDRSPGPGADLNLPKGRFFESWCKCSVAIFYVNGESGTGRRVSQQLLQESCRQVKLGIMFVTREKDGTVTRDLEFEQPFIFPPEDFEVHKRVRPSSKGRCSTTYGIADKYRLQIYLESHGADPEGLWPPLNTSFLAESELPNGVSPPDTCVSRALDDGEAERGELVLYCAVNNIFNPARQDQSVELKLCLGQNKQPSGYRLNTKIQWSLPSNMAPLLATKAIKLESPISRSTTQFGPTQELPSSPLVDKAGEMLTPDSPANSRSQRQRSSVTTYNLKTLSAQAQGRSPRKSKSRDSMARSDHSDKLGTTVTYSFGRADAVESGVKQQTVVAGLECPFCKCHNRTVEHLRFHLQNEHINFKFSLRRPNPPRFQFFVEVAKSRPALAPSERTLQLGKPMALFDLEKFLSGDDSWTRTRQGPEHNMWAKHLISNQTSLSSSPHESRHSSPNTSNATDDVMDLDSPKRLSIVKLPVRPRKTFLVPKAPRPLYDTINKRRLEPGEELPSSDDEKDETWLHQKHRDAINDFTDLTDDEKDFITKWNPFIMNLQLTSTKYLPEALLRFVEENKAWLKEKNSRIRRLTFECQAFLMRKSIERKTVSDCMAILRPPKTGKSTRQRIEPGLDAEEIEKQPSLVIASRGRLDCICGRSTQPPDRVHCRGKLENNCPGRFFHKTCAEAMGDFSLGKFLCHHCFSLESTA
ncbi:hypothetical protein BGZ60DRAFT_140210 [Tricladium varicosporioides]|nr:hypothetical protein BGZ60DRAFT_140210 [Hymenoscyphus varicosporioides]